ncbi:MAG: histidine kinase [Candidatus Krumholzibacteria bacterium]|nr:histidine kinase [Candidatus Krumholzibacteria bacterium]
MTGVTLSGDQFILFVLLLKMGIMAALAGALITSSFFKRLIFLDTRNTRQNWQFALVFGLLLTAGSAVRVLVGYEGMDLSLSGAFLVGLLGGMVPGSAVGFFVGLPGLLHGEWATLPFLVLCGLGGGIIRARTRDRDEFWSVSPFFLNNIVRSWRVLIAERRIDARAAIMLTLLALEAARTLAGDRAPAELFVFHPDHFWVTLCVWLTTLVCVGIPLKIWNNTRVEALLEEQRSAAAQARFDALRSQINPHFLFNVLNAATSLIWSEPEKARWILVKLSSILRRLLRGGEDFVPLSREIEFVEDYLSLEVARFGPEKLKVEKELDPRALDVPVPSMLLQPLVENAVRHGISPKVGGGVVRIEAFRDGGTLRVVVRDNGSGFKESGREGIGLRNVRERLRVAYGQRASIEISSEREQGTSVTILMPVERGQGGA